VLWWAVLIAGLWAKWKKIPAIYESVLLDSDTPVGILKERFGKLQVWCLKKFKAILAISDSLASDYLKYGFSTRQVHTLMNSVDSGLFHPPQSVKEKKILRKKFDLPRDASILLFVGSLIKRKGIEFLIQAFIGAYAKNPDLFLLIIGPKNKNENPTIDEDLIKDLSNQIKDHMISDRVLFAGLIQERQKLADIYRASDIFVFPSRQEGLPNVVLEAMATGLPVIVSQLPGLEKVIHHAENGLYVPIGDVAALEESILRVISDPFLSKKLGIAAQKYSLNKHGFTTWQSDLVRIYKQLLRD
jgi:glycosyltransferase involved in cell wall biosynthesis